jgi:hypothetical protein
VSLGQPVRDAPPPAPREALTFRTDPGTMRQVRAVARDLGISRNDALNIIVKGQLAADAARSAPAPTAEQLRWIDAMVASLGTHTTGEDGR